VLEFGVTAFEICKFGGVLITDIHCCNTWQQSKF
jgi:hypothetical protein